MRPADIALVTQSTGAFDRIARWLSRGFNDLGARLDLVTIDGPSGMEHDGTTRWIGLGHTRAVRSTGAIASYFRSNRPTLALSSPEFVSPYVLFAGRRAQVPVIPWEASFVNFGMSELAPRKRLLPTLQKRTYRNAPAVAAVSSDLLDHLGAFLGTSPPLELVENPVDVDEIRSLGARKESKTAAVRLVACGRISVHKGYDVLIEALAEAGDRLGDWELLVLGTGPGRRALREQIVAVGLKDRVQIRGEVQDPYPAIASADLFVHPARREGFGLAIAEAMALGVPVISTTCPGGPRRLLRGGGAGALVPPDDAGALSAAILDAIRSPTSLAPLVERAAMVVEEYSPKACAERMLELADRYGRPS
jgi:glycosyltransferase involved in cell wall biosynthesis